MRDWFDNARLFFLVLHFGACGVASGQDVPRLADIIEDHVEESVEPNEERLKFEVEIVVFANNAFDSAEERFDRRPGSDLPESDLPDPTSQAAEKRATRPVVGEEGPFPFSLLNPEELRLTAVYDKLKRLDAYQVLVHGGWIQEGLPEEHARTVELSVFGSPGLAGTLQLHLGRYLHMTAALDYHAPPHAALPPETYASNERGASSPQKFTLRQTRRMRSDELHYFDHPVFGLLVIVRQHVRKVGRYSAPPKNSASLGSLPGFGSPL